MQNRLPLLAGIGVSAIALLIYLFTLSPTVNFIDSGELITVAATGGIAHPPGYPLYTLLTIAAAALPVGTVAARVNLVSALAGAAACGLFYGLLYEVLRYYRLPAPVPARPPAAAAKRPVGKGSPAAGGRKQAATAPAAGADVPPPDPLPGIVPAVAAGGALILSTSLTFWSWATQAKMYSLHYVFVAGLFWLALWVRRAERAGGSAPLRLWIALAALFGLGVTNHTMIWLLVPGLAVLLAWPAAPDARAAWRARLRIGPAVLVAAALPLLLYGYLPLRSAQGPLLDWGSPDNWGDFWRHVTLWQSRVLVGRNTGPLLTYLGHALDLFWTQWGFGIGLLLLALAVGGVVGLARHARPLLVATGLTALITLVQTYNFQNAEVAAYNVPLYMMVLLWAGVGLDGLLRAGAAWWAARQLTGEPGGAGRALAAVPLALAVLTSIGNAGHAGHGDDYLADRYVHNAFKNFAPNALVITNNWYIVSPSYYLQYVQHERPDVAILDRKLLQYPFYIEYADRQYPALMGQVKELETPYAGLVRAWADGQPADTQRMSQLYFDMMRALVSRSLAAGRPVYVLWNDPGQEENYITQGLTTHPEGLALRVDAQPFTSAPPAPQFDWRGLLADPVPIDDLAQQVLAAYPLALDRLAAFAQTTQHADAAARFAAQAAQVRQVLARAAHP